MILTKCDIDIPKYWEHDKLLTNKDGETVAMYLAYNDKEIP